MTRAWEGIVFDNYQIVKELAQKTTTKKGLSIKVNFNDEKYLTGKKASDEFLRNMPVKFDEILPKWNYSFIPKLL